MALDEIPPSTKFKPQGHFHKPLIKPSFNLFLSSEMAMNSVKLLRLSIGLTNSLHSTRQLGLPWLSLIQVNRFSHLTQSPPYYPHLNPHTCYKYLNLHKNLLFSSKPESFIDLILSSNNWSEDIEKELEKLNPELTHESVVYVLLKLNKNPQKSLDFFKWVCVRKGFDLSYVPYTILLKNLACKNYVDYFWDVAYEMKEKGFYIDMDVYLNVNGFLNREKLSSVAKKWKEFHDNVCAIHDANDAAKNVVDLIIESDWSEEGEGKLKKHLKVPISESFLLRVFRELGTLSNARKLGKHEKSLRFFEWVSSYGGYKHNSVTYNAMLKLLAWPESISEFWDLVKKMSSEGYCVDFDSYVKISRRDLPVQDHVSLFELMMDGPYKPSVVHCYDLLKMLSLHCDSKDMVYRVVNKYVAAGFALNKSIYDGMHRFLCRIGDFDEAKQILEGMRGAGFVPDNITYSQEIFGLCNEKRFDDALKVIERMEVEGCVPDIKTWTILLQGYCKADQLDQALSVVAKMVEKNVGPDALSVDALINGFLSQNKLFGAYRFLVEMINKARVKPWHSTFKLMIEKLTEDGKTQETIDLLRLMKHQGYQPFTDPIVQYISKSGTIDDAKNFLKLLSAKGFPSTSANVQLIKSFVEVGRESDARDLLSSSPHHVRTQKEIRKMFGSDQASQPEQMAGRAKETTAL